MGTLEILLHRGKTLPVQKKDVKIKRLSTEAEPVVFSLRSLSWTRAAEIRKMGGDDTQIHMVLAGTEAPDLKNQALLDLYGAATPAELLKLMLLPGEIEDSAAEIDRLSGYRQMTVEAVKKK